MYFAYIEPSAVSYAVQAVAGTLIALGAVTGIIVTFIKKRAAKVLNMQNDKTKEIEEDIVINIKKQDEER